MKFLILDHCVGGKPSIVSVKTLIARERPGGSSKSLNLLSTEGFEQEPEVYELEIMQPPTRDDWITDIREAVDAASPGKKNLGFWGQKPL